MPVYINNNSGLAENLSPLQETLALKQGTHSVPLNDADGNPVNVAPKDAPHLLSQGYTQPALDQLQYLLKSAKYEGTGEKLKALGEEAGRSAIPFGGFTKAETALGVNPQEILNRSQELSEPEKLGASTVGLVGSEFIPGIGQANVLNKIGDVAKEVGGLGGKIPGYAAKYAAENAAFQLGDESSKYFMGDPEAGIDNAAAHIGMSGLIGGGLGLGIGGVSKAFDAYQGTNLSKALEAIRAKSNGEAISPLAQEIEHTGITLQPEIKSTMEQVPELQQLAQHLRESPTAAGREYQESLKNFHQDSAKIAGEFLGHTPEQIDALSNYSVNKAGTSVQENLIKDLESKSAPFSKVFDKISEKYKGFPVNDAERLALGDNLAEAGQKYAVTPSAPEAGKIAQMMREVPNIKTLEDLRNFASNHLGDIQGKQMFGLSKPVRGVLRNIEDVATTRTLGENASELIGEHAGARAGWKEINQQVDELNDALHVGKYRNVKGFIEKLRDMSPEKVLNRLTPENNANLLNTLETKFPNIANEVKGHYVKDALEVASRRGTKEMPLNVNKLMSTIKDWSPELRNFALSKEQQLKMGALDSMVKRLPGRGNPSGTAGALMGMLKKWPSGLASMLMMATGHSPITGYVLGEIGRIMGTEAPDAVKLATLRFLGSDAPINSRAFKSMTTFGNAIIKGNSTMGRAIKGVLKAGALELPRAVSDSEREKLDNRISELNQNPEQMLSMTPEFSHYMPDHGQALAQTMSRGVQYLKSLKPDTSKLGPLDTERVPSQMEKAKYNRALDIAINPLTVLKSVKDGTLTTQDVMHLHTLYPSMYKQMANKLTEQIINHKSEDGTIPYSQRMSLSLFLGQPLDSTMTPQSILNLQQINALSTAQAQAKEGTKLPKGSINSLNKLSSMTMLSADASQSHRALKS